MIVEVYRNLHKHGPAGEPIYSVRSGGRVVEHTPSIWLIGVLFVVRPAGQRRVLRERAKNVHAWVRGERLEPSEIPAKEKLSAPRLVTYDPYKGPTFYDRQTGEPITTARLAHVGPRGVEVWP